jgi:hypothetical protein
MTISERIRIKSVRLTVRQHGILERLAHWVLCAGSLVLCLSLISDWEHALWWALKAPSPRYWINDVVRWEKVALCLVWSSFIFLLYAYRYGMAARAIVALLASVLFVQVTDAVLKINADVIPYMNLVVKSFPLAILWFVTPVLLSAVLAYANLTKRAFAYMQARIASAITLGACSLMLWVGLFDTVYPKIGWR